MKRLAIVVFSGAILLAGSAEAKKVPASLRIVSQSPVSVRGAHFVPSERVRVTAVASGTLRRTVVANRFGTFTATFDKAVDRCSGLFVRAAGSRGTLAVAKLPQMMCMPQRSP